MLLIRYITLQEKQFENSSLSLLFDIPELGYVVRYKNTSGLEEKYFFIERLEAYQCFDHYFDYLNSEES